jgi:hypothetical protein
MLSNWLFEITDNDGIKEYEFKTIYPHDGDGFDRLIKEAIDKVRHGKSIAILHKEM